MRILEMTPVNNIVVSKAYREVLIKNRLDTFESFMEYTDGEIAKQVIKERSTVRLTLDEGGRQSTFFLKRYTAPSLTEYLKSLIRFSWPKSALDEWRAILRFHEIGLPTMVPVAEGEKRNSLGLVTQSFIVTKEIKGAYRLDAYLAQWLQKPLSKKEIQKKRRLIEQVAQLTRKMHTMGLNHRDYYLCHIFIRTMEENEDFELFIIDLHRVDIRKKVGKRWIIKDLAALHFSSLALPIRATDRIRFLKLYLQKDHLDKRHRFFVRQIFKKTERIAKHTEKMYKHVCATGKQAFHIEPLVLQDGRYRGACLRENRGLLDESFTSSPSDFMYRNGLEVLKDVCPVRVVRCGELCLKYYTSRGAKDILKRWCGMSKGKRSFQWALALLSRSIPTPEPVCYLDGQGGDSFYLSRFVDSAGNLADYLRRVIQEEQKKCLRALSLFLNRMFYQGVYHLDLKGTNVLVNNVGSTFQFYLTDTDEMAVYRKGMYKPLYKSLVRITRTLVPYFSRQELAAFAVRCLYNSPVTVHPQDVVDQAFKIETMKQS